MDAITVECQDDTELAGLYHMINEGRRHISSTGHEIAMSWRSDIANFYGGNKPCRIVFKGQDAAVLTDLAEAARHRCHNSSLEHSICNDILRIRGTKW